MTNPFDPKVDPDRHYIWQRLIVADCEAFVAGDFAWIEADFDNDSFEGIRCFDSSDPDQWRLALPTVESYRDAWLVASREFLQANAEPLATIFSRCRLDDIDINGTHALAHKKFTYAKRQTLYRLRKIGGTW